MTRWLVVRLRASAARSRADRHCRAAQIELERLRLHDGDRQGVAAAGTLLQEGASALDRGLVEHCWHFVNAAQRLIHSMQDDEQRAAMARVLRIESAKLSKWRRKAVEEVLADVRVPTPAALQQAMLLRDDYYETRYHRLAMQREQLRSIVIAGAAAVAVGLGGIGRAGLADDIVATAPWDPRVLMVVLAFGALGGSVSAARSITVRDLDTVIPELAMGRWITLTRLLLGSVLGLAAYVFLRSGLISLWTPSLSYAAATAFAAGFSEQFVLKVIDGFGSKDPKDG